MLSDTSKFFANVNDLLLFAAMELGLLIAWLNVFLNLHLCICDAFKLTSCSAFNSYPGCKYMYYTVGKFFMAEKVK